MNNGCGSTLGNIWLNFIFLFCILVNKGRGLLTYKSGIGLYDALFLSGNICVIIE